MTPSKIHPTAVLADDVVIGSGVEIGPYTVIGPKVKIGNQVKIHHHCSLQGPLDLGDHNEVYPFCSLGEAPQDLSFQGEETVAVIGEHNVFREYVSVHRGTKKDRGRTEIGSHNFFMASVHIAHDCTVENHTVMANNVGLAGHVRVCDRVIIGGSTGISQHITLGEGSYIGGCSALNRDIPPYCTALGNRVLLKGINIIGLRRRGVDRTEITALVDLLRDMEASAYSPRIFVEKVLEEKGVEGAFVERVCRFILKSEIGIPPFA